MMSKCDFVALADVIREFNSFAPNPVNAFSSQQINRLADFCQSQNGNFKRDRWLEYIAGNCGKNGGTIKPPKRTGEWNGVDATSVPMRDRLPHGSLAGMPSKRK